MGKLRMIHIAPNRSAATSIADCKGSILKDYAQEEDADVLWFDEESGAARIARERQRQADSEEWNDTHDDQWTFDELPRAAALYLSVTDDNVESVMENLGHPLRANWPWREEWFKPFHKGTRKVDRIRCLEKAGALIAAEIDRLKRSEKQITEESNERELIKEAILELMADGQMYAPMLIRSRLLTKKMINIKEIDFFRIMFGMEETGEVKYWTAEVTEAGKKETAHFYQITEGQGE